MKKGMVFLVGAGPGEEKLITVKGMELLKTCEVLVYDRLISEALLEAAPPECEKINVGKEVGNHAVRQEEINEILIQKALEGKKVVRLKGGDPFVFGRGGEEILALKEREIPYLTVPGITSCIAVPQAAGIPVTHRGTSQSFHVITGHTAATENELTEDFEVLAKVEGTLIFLMGVGNLAKIAEELVRNGKPENTPAAVITDGTLPNQKTVRGSLKTINEIVKSEDIQPPAVVVVGAAAELEFCDGVARRRRKVGVVGTRPMYEKVKELLEAEDVETEDFSFSKVVPQNQKRLEEVLRLNLKKNWLVFTSANGVRIFFDTVNKNGMDYRMFASTRFAVVGRGTAGVLREYGFVADYMPNQFSTKDLGKGLLKIAGKNEKILIPRGARGSREFTDILKKEGREYIDLPIYDIQYDVGRREKSKRLAAKMDYITFASASGVEGLLEDEIRSPGEVLGNAVPVCIGEATGKALKKYGMEKYIISEDCTAEGLAASILERIENESGF